MTTKLLFFILVVASTVLSACPFCDETVLKKQLVYEGREMTLLYCLTPASEGNVLVIPKRHITRFEELTTEEMMEAQKIIQALAPAYQEAYGVADYFLMQKNGVNAGQSQEHLHFHVFPCPMHLSKIIAKTAVYNPVLSDEEMKEACAHLSPFFLKQLTLIQR